MQRIAEGVLELKDKFRCQQIENMAFRAKFNTGIFIRLLPMKLDLLLARFYMTAKKCDGCNNEPDTCKSIQGSINSHLKKIKTL